MIGSFGVRRSVTVVLLALAWCGLWGSVTVANALAGLMIAVFVTSPILGWRVDAGLRVGAMLYLARLVFVDLVRSTVNVAAEVLTPIDDIEEGVVGIPLTGGGNDHLLLLTAAITLTPGTAVVDVDAVEGIVFVHLLHMEKLESTIEHVAELERAACAAFPPRGAA